MQRVPCRVGRNGCSSCSWLRQTTALMLSTCTTWKSPQMMTGMCGRRDPLQRRRQIVAERRSKRQGHPRSDWCACCTDALIWTPPQPWLEIAFIQSMSIVREYVFNVFSKSKNATFYVFTPRCTLVQSAVLRSHVVCLSVFLSVTLVNCDHIS